LGQRTWPESFVDATLLSPNKGATLKLVGVEGHGHTKVILEVTLSLSLTFTL
jgi:hypothetical protein